jgi:hypothetical protein
MPDDNNNSIKIVSPQLLVQTSNLVNKLTIQINEVLNDPAKRSQTIDWSLSDATKGYRYCVKLYGRLNDVDSAVLIKHIEDAGWTNCVIDWTTCEDNRYLSIIEFSGPPKNV